MRAEKQFFLDEIRQSIESANAMILMSYKGLKANETSDFRSKLHEAGAALKVVPKRMFLKAAEEAGITTLDKSKLEGHIGLALTEKKDPVALTKTLFKYAEESGERVEILGGQVEGRLYSPTDIKILSTLPGLEQMRAEFLGILEAPMSQTLAVFEALLTSVIYCLDNKSNKS